MAIKYYMKPDSNTPPIYAYVIADESFAQESWIEITQRPTENHIYNMDTSSWELSEESYMVNLRNKRNVELARTDKYMFEDFPIESTDIPTVLTYRQALRDCTNKTDISDRVLPECPEVCKK